MIQCYTIIIIHSVLYYGTQVSSYIVCSTTVHKYHHTFCALLRYTSIIIHSVLYYGTQVSSYILCSTTVHKYHHTFCALLRYTSIIIHSVLYYGTYLQMHQIYLGAFAKLRKATVSFVMCVSFFLSACKSSAPTGRISKKFDIWECV